VRPALWFRIAGVILLLFAAGHTVGFLTFRPDTAEGLAVWNGMQQVHFSKGGATFSYGGFYMGFGLCITLFDVFLAWTSFYLGARWQSMAREAAAFAWALILLQIAGFVLAVRYFSIAPASLTLLLTAAFLLAAIAIPRALRQQAT
jgi:hypothetical protein